MKDTEGRQRLPIMIERRPRRRGRQGLSVHVVLSPTIYALVQARDLAEDNRSLSRTIGHLLMDALSGDALTVEEARVVLRALDALATTTDPPDDVMAHVEQITAKIQRCFEGLT